MNKEELTTLLHVEKFFQIGCVVRDLSKTIKNYETIGIGPFTIFNLRPKKFFAKGHKSPIEINVANAELLPGLFLELIEVVSGETCHTDFLKKHGEGIQHLGFLTDEYDQVLNRAEALGIEVILWIHDDLPALGGRVRGAYFDTYDLVGCIIEILEVKPL